MVLHNYEYFVAIVEAGSLTKAAEHLYVSQPSLSQYLKRLEASLGVELFDRSTSPLRLTYTGERYYQYVLQMMKLDENVRREFQDIKNQTSGRLRLGVALWRGACLLPDVFPTFHQQYPDIHIELTEGRSVQLEAALMNDKIDLAVMNLPRTLDYSKLVSEIVCEERLLIAAPTQHPYVQGLLADCQTLGGYPVAQGMACVFVPEEGAKVCQHPGAVTYFAVDSPDLVWDLAAVYRKDTYLTRLSQLFIEVMKQRLQRE